jgi:hypothetical protein
MSYFLQLKKILLLEFVLKPILIHEIIYKNNSIIKRGVVQYVS